ncbi:hypothetical protein pdam_00000277 [Pocillopora damicornis]|uniref:Phosphoribosyltransferase domain-containing protein n=1 Tax=Pocillopora damicornis TaxID=46731 RepID=A0A3M6UJR6_POCDA|nr:hypothetical protein pdam_00000277 [Pocillopora damicornis]
MTGEGLGSREVDEHRLQRIIARGGKRGLFLCLRIRRLNCFVVGVHTIAYAYPKVKIVTAAVDPEVNDKYHVIPGIGNFGDRYFGTAN